LVGSFIFSAFLLLLLECELLALLFIIVYVGAIAVLFLFAIMMLESKLSNLSKNSMKYAPIGFIFGILLLFPLVHAILNHFNSSLPSESFYFNIFRNWYDLIDSTTDVEIFGQILYGYFVLQVLIVGLILLLVLLGVVYLTNQSGVNNDIREQILFKQLSREFKFLKK
jgi:NADH-quinone oxidoreductase subunit J